MIRTPSLKKCFHVESIPSEGVFLLSEFGHFVLNGRLEESVIPLIDGKRTVDEIAEELAEHTRAEEVYYTLLSLEQNGFIVESDTTSADTDTSIWNYLGGDSKSVRERFETAQLGVLTTPDLDSKPMIEALAAQGLRLGEQQDFTVVLTSDYLRPELEEINREALRRGKPWMLVKPIGAVAYIGPIFQPGDTGCWECLAQRLRSNREVEAFLEQKGCKVPFPMKTSLFSSILPATVNLAAFHAAKYIAFGSNPQLEGKIITLELSTLITTTHQLVKRPQCRACGKPEIYFQHPAPLDLQSQKKVFTADGGHRCSTPEETFMKYQHHISPLTGIVNNLTPIQKSSGDTVNIYLAGHNFAMKSDSLYFLRKSLRSKSGGKGMTDIQARTSAICEAIERYCGVYKGEEPCLKATFHELGDRAIHPNSCMNFSLRQYQNRQEWLRRGSPFQVVPVPFNPDAQIDWTPVWSFKEKNYKYLPTSYCYYGYPANENVAYCWADSNGNAAGNTLEEAILQGFLELVERDAVCLWWYNRLRRPGVDLDNFNEPYIEKLRNYYQSIGRELWVLNLTSDFEIPTFAAISRRVDQPMEEIILGFGAHLDARIGILRALTEMNQFLAAVNAVGANGTRQYNYADHHAIQWWQTATIYNQPYLIPQYGARPCKTADFSRYDSDDVLTDVMFCINQAEKLGMETLVLDQTRPDVGMSVAKVIVPGMRHFWARFAPGRLYDVPVKQGLLPYQLQEEQLNPIPMFL